MPPRVSVLLNSYNQRAFLAQAVESVLAQTFGDFELIALDNGSTDGSDELLRSYASDPRVRLLLRKDNCAISKRFNEALREARGEFVSFLYSDDYYLPTKLEHQLKIFDSLDASYGVVYGPSWAINELTGKRWRLPSMEGSGAILERMFEDNHLGSINMLSPLTRRACFEGEPFHEDLFAEGEAYFYRVAMRSHFRFDPEPLVVLRDHGSNAGKALRRNHEMTMICLERLGKHAAFPNQAHDTLRRFVATLHRDQGWCMVRLNGDMHWARQCFAEAVRLQPTHLIDPKVFVGATLSLAPAQLRSTVNRIASKLKVSHGNAVLVADYK